MPPSDLDQRLLDAHATGDGPTLVSLYYEASNKADTDEAAGFYLTHAYVFALEAGDPRAAQFRQQLIEMSRDV